MKLEKKVRISKPKHSMGISGVIITADQRSVARNELTTDRTKFILSDQFGRMVFMFDLQLSYFHLYMCVLGFHAMKHIAQM